MVTDLPTHKQTGPITIHCATASMQCNYHLIGVNVPDVDKIYNKVSEI